MIATLLRRAVQLFVRVTPDGTPEFLYEKVFVGPLRTVFNRFVLALLPTEVELPEGTLLLNPKDPIVSGMLAFNMYEPFETSLFRTALKEGMTVIDIGANIGLFSLIASRSIGNSGRVIAFEPEEENRVWLNQTIARNTLANVEVSSLAVSYTKEVRSLHLYSSNKGKHSLVKDGSDDKGFNETVEISTIDLDSFLADRHIEEVGIIKMDIEGAESLALRGMQKTLHSCAILFMEFTPTSIRKCGDDPSAVLNGLQKMGFTIFVIEEQKKLVIPITDFDAFVTSIAKGKAVNLLCRRETS